MTAYERYQEWLSSPVFDEVTKQELRTIESNEKEIEDRFYQELEFGTGGLRGILGAGTNRMNSYTVRKATQGLANFILEEGGQDKGVAIAYDSRQYSKEFAKEAAQCFTANGIRVYLFEDLRPTPELSFAVRELKCIAGIVITASHNPPEYNGYKVYWEDGAQITPPKDIQIITRVGQVTDYSKVKTMDEEEALKKGRLTIIGREIDDRYLEELKKLTESREAIQQESRHLKIVYTPLHGSGNIPVRRVLKELGFEQVWVVPEQEQPDGAFPTVSYPNPEDPNAFRMALDLAEKVDADLVLATDPDADRLGVYVKGEEKGVFHPLTGNMSGILLCEYLLSRRKEKRKLPENGAIIKTIVTTDMADELASRYHMKLIETLTGFKFIGEQIKRFEQEKTWKYMFGFEESYGCLVGTHARDKDAVAAVMCLCEAAAFYRQQGKTLWEQMMNIFETYGFYLEGLDSITLEGEEGKRQIQEMIARLRNNPLQKIDEYEVGEFRDYQTGEVLDYKTMEKRSSGLPKSNVLYYKLNHGAWFCVRPSGTEPKIKFYYGVKGSNLEDARDKLETLIREIKKLI